jgi:formylglycine-generating enzyme required for sulfatase activity/outer membrane protein assembly factor BamB
MFWATTFPRHLGGGIALLVLLFGRAATPAAEAPSSETICADAGVNGGLCVLVGGGDSQSAASLAASGRYLVHMLEPDVAGRMAALRRELHARGVYGLASADRLGTAGTLPYTENLVNALFLGKAALGRVSLQEVWRVLRPRGVLFILEDTISDADLTAAGFQLLPPNRREGLLWRAARKPWPGDMDGWSHARHGADGNAVSQDAQVGPPRRVRWLAAPPQEISNTVTAGGRLFYAGVTARDGFNGLRLWQRRLNPTPARGGFYFDTVEGAVQPVATADCLLVMTDQRLRALDAVTGREIRQYPAAGLPSEVLLTDGTILAIDRETIRALFLDTAELRWRREVRRPRYTVAGDGMLFSLEHDAGDAAGLALVCRGVSTGSTRWRQTQEELLWLPSVRRLVYHKGHLACEISTLTDAMQGNAIHVLAAADGKSLWSRSYIPLSGHFKQARAMFIGDLLWIIEQNKMEKGHLLGVGLGLDPHSGAVKRSCQAGATHCFPPVATCRYMCCGEMKLCDLVSGAADDYPPITKMACGRDAGIVPANGLIYAPPKRCICWPMLRDYVALAPARPRGEPRWDDFRPALETGPAQPPPDDRPEDPAAEWTCYRHDPLRSGATPAQVSTNLRISWTTSLSDWPRGQIADDWRTNYFIRGPLGPPVVAGNLVYVARPDAHQVVALDAATGKIRWTFTANGRVDTAPTIHRGLCLLGCKSGWVYCLRADDGREVWRLRAAPLDERIVAYGQLESPWPVPGSVLVIDDVAYFAAGRQPSADGGIFIFAVEPRDGRVRWVRRLRSVPQTDFYESSGIDFENYDLLHREGDAVAMSRWMFDRQTGKMSCQAKSGFARLGSAAAAVLYPRGAWSYAPPHEAETWGERPFLRPLAVFQGNTLYACSQDRRTVFRRDFQLDSGEKFNTDWYGGSGRDVWNAKYGLLWRSQRLARGAAWSAAPFPLTEQKQTISALVLAGDVLCAASSLGSLCLLDGKSGAVIQRLPAPPAAWDGLAAAHGRLFLSTQDGRLVCLEGNQAATTRKVAVSRRAECKPEGAERQQPQTRSFPLAKGVELDLVLIHPGAFMMGDARGSKHEQPVHKVTIIRPFYLGKYLVTQEQWQAVMGNNPSLYRGPRYPVDSVSWDSCDKCLNKLNERFGSGGKFALPSEAQWEYACRAGSRGLFGFGDAEERLRDYAWFSENAGGATHPVGEKRPNAWGLYDMHGNVWQWCADWYADEYYKDSPAADPPGPAAGKERVMRGGSWYRGAFDCRSASRYSGVQACPDYANGFRVMWQPAEASR